jgi:hypothetical protein
MAENVRKPILYPKHLNLYAQCPERYYHERIERPKTGHAMGTALVRGIAVHHVLSDVAKDYEAFIRDHGVPAVASDLVRRAERALPRDPYPDEAAWASDVKALVAEVQYGVAYLDGEARVLATEATFQYPYGGSEECPPFVLAAKVDAVLLRHDTDGRAFLDIVDWKGGNGLRHDPIQELVCRIAVQYNANRRFEVAPAYFQNTTVYVSAKAHRSVVIPPSEGQQRWAELKQLVAGMVLAGDWTPNPSPLCEWCPFFGNGCSLGGETGPTDEVSNWLDAVAV